MAFYSLGIGVIQHSWEEHYDAKSSFGRLAANPSVFVFCLSCASPTTALLSRFLSSFFTNVGDGDSTLLVVKGHISIGNLGSTPKCICGFNELGSFTDSV